MDMAKPTRLPELVVELSNLRHGETIGLAPGGRLLELCDGDGNRVVGSSLAECQAAVDEVRAEYWAVRHG